MACFMHQITESLDVDGCWEALTPAITFRAVDEIGRSVAVDEDLRGKRQFFFPLLCS